MQGHKRPTKIYTCVAESGDVRFMLVSADCSMLPSNTRAADRLNQGQRWLPVTGAILTARARFVAASLPKFQRGRTYH